MTAPRSSSSRLVDSLSSKLGPRMSRRGFFARSAVVGSALAAAPVDYVLKPGTAYAAICACNNSNCDCGSLCCDGYTEFCCTIYGNNQCPPGTALGGWWKADGTGLCGGPRYYMDCNANCGGCGCGGNGICSGACTGTNCGCANGDCNNRKSGCVQFRYGQCNQATACLGPIVCRVVTCIPPWQIDPSCTTLTLVDQNTAFHDRPCLHKTIGALESAIDAGGVIRVTGWALDFDTSAPIDVHVYVDNALAGAFTANRSRNDIATAYPGQGPQHGFDISIPAARGAHKVDVYAINVGPGTSNPLLGTANVTVASPFGNFEQVSGGLNAIRAVGWALDPDTANPIDVHVYVDGVGMGGFSANKTRNDVAAIYPAAGAAHGFDFTIPATAGSHTVTVYGINVGSGANTTIGSRAVTVNPNPIGNVELAVPDLGTLRVVGWAIDPDSTGPVTVHVYVDGVGVAIGTADVVRNDVAATFPGYGAAHGFDISTPISNGRHTVDVYAINVGPGNTNTLLGRRTVNVGASPIGNVEAVQAQVGQVRVLGWALDYDTPASIDVQVSVDGGAPVQATASLPRNDVAAAFPGYGPNHGFDVVVPVATGGAHTVQVVALNVGAATGNSLVGTKGVTTGGNPFGSLDSATPGAGSVRLTGWAVDPDNAAAIDVHVYVDGVMTIAATASLPRNDVAAVFAGAGVNHGFDLTVPVGSGAHRVDVYAINAGTGTANPLIGTATVTVP